MLGRTVLYGEYAEYNNQTANGIAGGVFNALPACTSGDCFVDDSTAKRWGLGVVQEIDSAAMHVWARWQHQDLDLSLFNDTEGRVSQGFDNFDLYQVGAIMFF